MVKHSDEIPVTYLNKGQVYSLSIVDTNGPSPEGGEKRTRVELESSSFDGFAVTWTTGASGAAELNLALRFNFLSTDFSHSKGVKGIPVRLCAKTQLLPLESAESGSDSAPEICYCKVKLFRDHGAERKLSNDVAHVKKSVEKLKQHIEQAENGHKDSKRKRSNGIVKVGDGQRVAKTHKHKRTWSLSSASSTSGGPRPSLEDDMHFKLQSLQDMFTSTRPISVLAIYLSKRTLADLNDRIAAKWGLDASRIIHTTRTTKSGLEIEVDDDMVQAINEGQDMELRILQAPEQQMIKEEWEMVVDGDEDKGDAWSPPPGTRRSSTPGLVLKLVF
ncbi:Grainyhead-like protein 2 -like protein [Escovopsis weberi]|uniref:Grainyhead-like protein 2-like protein n=1 Tax=Escovopsis weberi TaxID=150374 RepID=A0A0M8MQY4_ESCWE|nr:Grainyhead-like protein 2 -like protein [Escovopsis weberi]